MDSPDCAYRFDAGVCMPSSCVDVSQKNEIVQSRIKHYFYHVAKAELDQLKSGLDLLGVHSLMLVNRKLFKPLLVASGKTALSCDSLLKLFTVSWSPHGSNQRELEEAVILGWTEYVNGIGGIIIETSPCDLYY